MRQTCCRYTTEPNQDFSGFIFIRNLTDFYPQLLAGTRGQICKRRRGNLGRNQVSQICFSHFRLAKMPRRLGRGGGTDWRTIFLLFMFFNQVVLVLYFLGFFYTGKNSILLAPPQTFSLVFLHLKCVSSHFKDSQKGGLQTSTQTPNDIDTGHPPEEPTMDTPDLFEDSAARKTMEGSRNSRIPSSCARIIISHYLLGTNTEHPGCLKTRSKPPNRELRMSARQEE